ncbi:MAG: hypothetical protein SGJ10_01400 [Bacteroidota bacterium]|nr:hypothetical protein [Bacteroidota bacterium]
MKKFTTWQFVTEVIHSKSQLFDNPNNPASLRRDSVTNRKS